MNEMLALKTQITYGPVNSRRLGRSLGINLLPAGKKTCTFDCLYCQYGWTPTSVNGRAEAEGFPAVEDVVTAVEIALRGLAEPPAYLTFSGNGEPTLHPDFPLVVDAVSSLRNRRALGAMTALLSNASRMGDPAIRSAVSRIDCPILKLDAGSEDVFRFFNRPVVGTDFVEMVAGLKAAGPLTLQSLFASGPKGNIRQDHLDRWRERVLDIRPRDVQVYSLSRPVPSSAITPVSPDVLAEICLRLRKEGIEAERF